MAQKEKRGKKKVRGKKPENKTGREIKNPVRGRKGKLSKEEKQTLVIVLFMVAAVAAFLIFFFVYRNIGTFLYHGIKFQKVVQGGVTIYHGRIGLSNSKGTFNYNLYIRNDPRKLKMPVNVSVALRKTGYISFQPETSKCYASSLAAFELASLLSALGIDVKGATTSHETAIDENIPERDCADALNKTVIVLQQSPENSISQRGDCYVLNVSNCRIVETTEAFMLEIIKGLWKISAS
ncbi:hypothetical protein J4433_01625 [Candidatus Pacearchaeota archaeon]|nr:hypothetical protein [Candidatus Pacearchaeota archaeon]